MISRDARAIAGFGSRALSRRENAIKRVALLKRTKIDGDEARLSRISPNLGARAGGQSHRGFGECREIPPVGRPRSRANTRITSRITRVFPDTRGRRGRRGLPGAGDRGARRAGSAANCVGFPDNREKIPAIAGAGFRVIFGDMSLVRIRLGRAKVAENDPRTDRMSTELGGPAPFAWHLLAISRDRADHPPLVARYLATSTGRKDRPGATEKSATWGPPGGRGPR